MHSSASQTPIVLIHGWAGSSRIWGPVAELLSEEWQGELIAISLPGSPTLENHRPVSIIESVRVVTSMLGRLTSPAIVVGHSMGAQVSLLTQLAAPERVLGEVVIDPAYGAEGDIRGEMSEWADRIDLYGHEAVLNFFVSAFGQRLPRSTQTQIINDVLVTSPSVIAEYLRCEYVYPDSIGRRDATVTAARRRSRPVLALHSSPAAAAFEAELQSPNGSDLMDWSGYGHYLHLENPKLFVQQVISWAKTLPLDAATGRGLRIEETVSEVT